MNKWEVKERNPRQYKYCYFFQKSRIDEKEENDVVAATC